MCCYDKKVAYPRFGEIKNFIFGYLVSFKTVLQKIHREDCVPLYHVKAFLKARI
jgi:hypothetical protein